MIIVPATGVFWSTVWSTIARGGECLWAYDGIVYGSDLRLALNNSKPTNPPSPAASANLTVSITAGVACTEHVLLRSMDSQRSLDVIWSKSYQYGEGRPQRALTTGSCVKGICIERSYI